ncbi:hypothetical protein ANN_16290 [Periplaneta americana]|uniref:Tc1-like transposase DDE domain-containing protein n=1 Tax=Periplaneta americana TaxID=6978 RepID=A0ABQ8SJT9_PERAM|nr:hypothetical protein ANN_16290 [Periplaneta americana]
MAGLCEGGNEPSGSLKAICEHLIALQQTLLIILSEWMHERTEQLLGQSHFEKKATQSRKLQENLVMVLQCLASRRLTGQAYTNFLENTIPHVLEDTPLISCQHIHFLHDGSHAHFSRAARRYLDRRFPDRWIGRCGPIAWPPRSPDLNTLDFYLWGHLKSLVYSSSVPDLESLRNRIVPCSEDIRSTLGVWDRVRRSMRHRCEVCIQAGGGHFEHLL